MVLACCNCMRKACECASVVISNWFLVCSVCSICSPVRVRIQFVNVMYVRVCVCVCLVSLFMCALWVLEFKSCSLMCCWFAFLFRWVVGCYVCALLLCNAILVRFWGVLLLSVSWLMGSAIILFKLEATSVYCFAVLVRFGQVVRWAVAVYLALSGRVVFGEFAFCIFRTCAFCSCRLCGGNASLLLF